MACVELLSTNEEAILQTLSRHIDKVGDVDYGDAEVCMLWKRQLADKSTTLQRHFAVLRRRREQHEMSVRLAKHPAR